VTGKSRDPWEKLAQKDAYYAVLTEDRFRAPHLDEASYDEFFRQGQQDIRHFFELIHTRMKPNFSPLRTLEFGCGVGRLLIPLAGLSATVTGIDVSPSMLKEARKNLLRRNLDNFELFRLDEAFEKLTGRSFDFIVSYIVFQHIRPPEGLVHLEKLLSLLAPGGIGLIHLMISGGLGRLGKILQRSGPGKMVLNVLRRRPLADPVIPMYTYPLNDVLSLVRKAGTGSLHVELTDHGGEVGALLIFEKNTA